MVEGESTITDFRNRERNIELPADKPFFLAAGIFAPHLPWVVEQEYYDLFPQSEMAIDRALLNWIEGTLKDLPPSGQRWTQNTGFTRLLEFGLKVDGEGGDINAWRAKFQAYLATVAYADRCIGVLLEAIESNPRKDNTVVILWSDHGYHIGDHMREGKTTLWEAANLSNILVIDPRAPESAGKRSQTPISLQDLYPTVAGMAGLGRPGHVHGNNIAPLLGDPSQSWDGAVLNTHGENNHAIRTERYRYIRYANGDQELYDMQADPFETTNMAADESHAALLAELNAELDNLLSREPGDFR
jgi:arylsulfatase A-like enzyme